MHGTTASLCPGDIDGLVALMGKDLFVSALEELMFNGQLDFNNYYQIHFIGLEMRLVFVNPGDDGVDGDVGDD